MHTTLAAYCFRKSKQPNFAIARTIPHLTKLNIKKEKRGVKHLGEKKNCLYTEPLEASHQFIPKLISTNRLKPKQAVDKNYPYVRAKELLKESVEPGTERFNTENKTKRHSSQDKENDVCYLRRTLKHNRQRPKNWELQKTLELVLWTSKYVRFKLTFNIQNTQHSNDY